MSLEEKLVFLYGKEIGKETLVQLNELIESLKPSIPNAPKTLSEKDSILITYGDQIQKEGASHLRTLKTFMDDNLENKISSVHILPFYPYTSDDGFSVVDYLQVDPNLGEWTDVKELSESYRVMFDAVVNHCSQANPWFQAYLADDEEYKNFFHDMDPNLDLSSVTRPRALPLLTPFKTNTGTKNIWTTFSADQVDLNFSNPKVLLSIVEVLLKYLSYGASLVRLDAIAFLWKTVGTNCLHLPQTHTAVKLFREVFDKVAPSTVMITETNVPHDENISYYGNGNDEAHMVYNFSLPPLVAFSLLKGNTQILSNWAASLELPSSETCFFNFTASHDGVGVRPVSGILDDDELQVLVDAAINHGGKVSYKNNGDGTKSPYELNCCYADLLTSPEDSNQLRFKRFILSQAIMLSMPGVPGIYFHSLVGSRNDISGMQSSGINRRINREKLKYDSLVEELSQSDSYRNTVFSEYLRLLDIRSNEKAFNPFTEFSILSLSDQVFALQRGNGHSGSLLCLYNVNSEVVDIDLPEAFQNKIDLIQQLNVSESVSLEAYQFAWIKA